MGLAPEDAFSALPTTLRDDLLSAFNENGTTEGSGTPVPKSIRTTWTPRRCCTPPSGLWPSWCGSCIRSPRRRPPPSWTPEGAPCAPWVGLIEREVAWVWTHGDMKRVMRTGTTWKQQTLLLMLTETGDVAEADLFRWLEHPSLPSFRRDVLKQLHKARQVEYDTDKRTVRLLPAGVTAAEKLVAAAP